MAPISRAGVPCPDPRSLALERLIVATLVALYPTTDGVPGIDQLDPDEFVRRFHREADPLLWLGVVLGSLIFQLSPLLTMGIPLPAAWLSPERLDRHAARVTAHPLYFVREPIAAVKVCGGLLWGAHPLVRAHFAMQPYSPDPRTFRASQP